MNFNFLYAVPICFNFIEWVRDNIFQPLIEFTAKVFIDIFMSFLSIIISQILEAVIKYVYLAYVAILKVVDILQDIFSLISGTQEIAYTVDNVKKTGYLTEILIRLPQVTRMFWLVWLISVLLCFIFLVAAVVRSISDLSGRGQSINDVIKTSAKAFVLFMVVQIAVFGIVSVGNIVLSTTQQAMSYSMGSDTEIRMSNAVFATTTINAVKPEGLKETGDVIKEIITGKRSLDTGKSAAENWDNYCKAYYTGAEPYYDYFSVTRDFMLIKIDYLAGLICVIFIVKFMAGSAIVFVQRIILVVVGFITAPIFIAFTPLDGGARFERWKDFFIGNCLNSFSIILSVNIYMIVIPLFAGMDLGFKSTIVTALFRTYSIAMMSMAFEKCGDIVGRIISDSGIMGPGQGFEMIMSLRGDIAGTKRAFGGGAKPVKKMGGK